MSVCEREMPLPVSGRINFVSWELACLFICDQCSHLHDLYGSLLIHLSSQLDLHIPVIGHMCGGGHIVMIGTENHM